MKKQLSESSSNPRSRTKTVSLPIIFVVNKMDEWARRNPQGDAEEFRIRIHIWLLEQLRDFG